VAQSPILTSDRLEIAPFVETYCTEDYVRWLNDPEVVRYSNQRHTQHTLTSCQTYFQSFTNSPHYFWIILLQFPQGHRPIGTMTAYLDRANAVADVGIMIGDKSAWGQGYGFEAWITVFHYLFNYVDIRKITAGTLSVNHPMLALMQKAKMRPDGVRIRQALWEGLEVDIIHMAAFREDWLRISTNKC